jgi:hypothetical protein
VTVHLGDFSNHDRNRIGRPIPLADIRRDGYCGALHKLSEGAWTDPWAAEASPNMRDAGFAVAGIYHVVWPAQSGQAAYVWGEIKRLFPWLLDHPCPVMMADAEIFQEFTPYRAPTIAEVHTYCDEFRALSGWEISQLPVYAPEWVYGDAVRQLRYPWVSSKYVNGCGPYRDLYPGDSSTKWDGPAVPLWLQFTACATVDGLPSSDSNAARFPSEANFVEAIKSGDTMTQVDSLTPEALTQIATAVRDVGMPPYDGTLNKILNDIRTRLVNAATEVHTQTATLKTQSDTLAGLVEDVAAVQASVDALSTGGPITGPLTGNISGGPVTITPPA